MATKIEVFESKKKAYFKATKKGRSEILDQVLGVVKMTRKAAIRRFRVLQLRDPCRQERRGRKTYYTPDITSALKELWDMAGEPCGENLHAVVSEYIRAMERDNQWNHDDLITGKLRAMSMSTVKLRVAWFVRMSTVKLRGKSSTRPGSIISMIPVRMDGWKEAPVGTEQIDTVAHCGDSLMGEFIYTVNSTDVATLWGEREVQWCKGQEATVRSIEAIDARTPYPCLEKHPDSGGEFINWHCHAWCEAHHIKLTRSRPYKKNDNCFVEERNGHVVRRWLKYDRFDVKELVPLINEFYAVLTPFLNHFTANRRIISKGRVGARWVIKREKKAKTPYERMLERSDVSEEIKAKLRAEHEKLSPLTLKRLIDERLKRVFDVLNQARKTQKQLL